MGTQIYNSERERERGGGSRRNNASLLLGTTFFYGRYEMFHDKNVPPVLIVS